MFTAEHKFVQMFTCLSKQMFTDVSNVHNCTGCEGPSHDTFVIGFQLGPIFGYFHRQIAICWVVAAWICHRREPYLCNHHRWFVRPSSAAAGCKWKIYFCKILAFFSLIGKQDNDKTLIHFSPRYKEVDQSFKLWFWMFFFLSSDWCSSLHQTWYLSLASVAALV